MSSETKPYTEEQLTRLTAAAQIGLRMSESDAQDYAKNIFESGIWALFGYGSLIGDPIAGGFIEGFAGRAKGVSISPAAVECYFRGTETNIHLTSTAVSDDEGYIDGFVQVYWKRDAGAMTTEADILFLEDKIGNYAARESGPNPRMTATYIFVPFPVTRSPASDEAPVLAVICVADEKRPNYMGPIVGDPFDLDSPDVAEITWRDFAALEALASGPDRNPETGYGHELRPTGISYWRFLVSNWAKAGFAQPKKPYEAVMLMNAVRNAIDEAIQQNNPKLTDDIRRDHARIVELEARPAAATAASELHEAAFGVPSGFAILQDQAIAMVLTARDKITQRWQNQCDAHFGGPNTPEVGQIIVAQGPARPRTYPA